MGSEQLLLSINAPILQPIASSDTIAGKEKHTYSILQCCADHQNQSSATR